MVGVLIVGPGQVAPTHARALVGLGGGGLGVRLVAVCRRHEARTAAFAAQDGARPTTSPGEALAARDVGVVIFCTPHPLHTATTCWWKNRWC